jgi:hypothetical protein
VIFQGAVEGHDRAVLTATAARVLVDQRRNERAFTAIRTFLSFSLELEITGRWPWQKTVDVAAASTPSTE